MHYVIMDLEWNNTYAKKSASFINEIIEIGAVMLDDSFNQIDTFSQVIKSQIGRKLRGRVKRLTHITNDDIHSGVLFTKAFSEFRKWLGKEETVIFTWGDCDIRVLVENFSYLNGIKTIPFLSRYCNLQDCYHRTVSSPSGTQVGLLAAAQSLGIDPDSYSLHRALDDSLLSAEVFRRIFNKAQFEPYYKTCNDEFYGRLFFKAKVISNIDNPLVDKKEFYCNCEKCFKPCEQKSEWKYHNQFFRAVYYCPDCNLHFNAGVRFKKYFDRVEIRRMSKEFDPNQKKQEKKDSAVAEAKEN